MLNKLIHPGCDDSTQAAGGNQQAPTFTLVGGKLQESGDRLNRGEQPPYSEEHISRSVADQTDEKENTKEKSKRPGDQVQLDIAKPLPFY